MGLASEVGFRSKVRIEVGFEIGFLDLRLALRLALRFDLKLDFGAIVGFRVDLLIPTTLTMVPCSVKF